MSSPNPPMMAYFATGGSCARPPRRRDAAPADAANTGADAAAICGVSTAVWATASAANWAASTLRRFSPSFCSSLAALTLSGLMATTWRRQSSFSASSIATVLSHSQAFSLRGSVTSARLKSSRAFSFMPRLAAMMP